VTLFGLDGAMAASVLMFTLDGVPMLYNGMEVGESTESGGDAMFSRLKIFWPIAARRPQFLPFYRKLVALRRGSKTLQHGEVEWLGNSAAESVLVFRRRGPDEILVAVNLSNRPVHFAIEGWDDAGGYSQLFGDAEHPSLNMALNAWGSGVWLKAAA
jgi:cyclomaltodextrinase